MGSQRRERSTRRETRSEKGSLKQEDLSGLIMPRPKVSRKRAGIREEWKEKEGAKRAQGTGDDPQVKRKCLV